MLPATSSWKLRPVLLLMLALSAVLSLPSAQADDAAAKTASLPTFMILLRDGAAYQASRSDEEHRARVAEYGAWARDLARQGLLIEADELSNTQWTISNGQVRQRPIRAGREHTIVGYFLIRARNVDEAVAIAKQCPHVRYRGSVDVRPIQV
jgi:hypothetical protein